MEKLHSLSIDLMIKLAFALIIVAIGLIVIKIIVNISKKVMVKVGMDKSLCSFFSRCIKITGYIIISISALSELNVSTTGIIAGFSAAAAALALALKDSLSDIASGIVILFTRPFITGDFIEFGDHKGFVEKIDIMHTYIRTYDDTNVVIPNSNITGTEVNNYTKNPEIRVELFVPVGYDADIDEVKKVIFETIKNIDNIIENETFSPKVKLENFGESSVNLAVRVWTQFENYWNVYYGLTEGIKKAFDSNNIPIPYNQLDIHIQKN